MIPHNVNYKSYTRETYKQIKDNITNSFKNAAACVSDSLFPSNFLYLCFCRLSALASANSVPGVTTSYTKSLWQKIRQVPQIFTTQSVESDSLVAPFREMALQLYMLMNHSIAKFVIFMVSILSLLLFSLSASFPPAEARRTSEKSLRSPTKSMFWRC